MAGSVSDRFFAAAVTTRCHQQLRRLEGSGLHLLLEIEAFFMHYAGLNGKELRVVRRSGPLRARELLKAGGAAFEANR